MSKANPRKRGSGADHRFTSSSNSGTIRVQLSYCYTTSMGTSTRGQLCEQYLSAVRAQVIYNNTSTIS